MVAVACICLVMTLGWAQGPLTMLGNRSVLFNVIHFRRCSGCNISPKIKSKPKQIPQATKMTQHRQYWLTSTKCKRILGFLVVCKKTFGVFKQHRRP